MSGINMAQIAPFVLSLIALCAGRWPGPLEGFAILTVDTSSLAKSPNSLAINDWYEAHYLSVCTGQWNSHVAQMGKNHSTAVCWLQDTGYTFSIPNLVPVEYELQALLATYRTLHTRAPFILLVLSIVSKGLAIPAFLYGIIMMAKSRKNGQVVKRDLPLIVLRIAFFACIISSILGTISSAKITASAGKSSGTFDLDAGRTIHAWTNSGFLAITWVGTGLVWVAMGLVVAAAFRLAGMLKRDDRPAVEIRGLWYRSRGNGDEE